MQLFGNNLPFGTDLMAGHSTKKNLTTKQGLIPFICHIWEEPHPYTVIIISDLIAKGYSNGFQTFLLMVPFKNNKPPCALVNSYKYPGNCF